MPINTGLAPLFRGCQGCQEGVIGDPLQPIPEQSSPTRSLSLFREGEDSRFKFQVSVKKFPREFLLSDDSLHPVG